MTTHVDRRARLGTGNVLGNSVVIGPDVAIGDDNEIQDGVVIRGPAVIGSDNRIASGTVIGGDSRQRFDPLARRETPTDAAIVRIGSGCLVFELVTIHRAMVRETVIGDGVAVGAHSHVAHDSVIGDNAILSVQVAIGGFSRIGQRANLGIGVRVLPRVVLGDFVFGAMSATLTRHVPPFARVMGVPAIGAGVNRVGLIRAGWPEIEIDAIGVAYESGDYEGAPKAMRDALARFQEAQVEFGCRIEELTVKPSARVEE
jgi:UDP-N-acetylglucosamine acyltransferase